jgi:hypothetical protein
MEQRYSSTLCSASAPDWGRWLTPRPGSFTPSKTAGTHCTEHWVGPTTGLHWCEKSLPPPGSDPRPSTRNESLYLLSYRGSRCSTVHSYALGKTGKTRKRKCGIPLTRLLDFLSSPTSAARPHLFGTKNKHYGWLLYVTLSSKCLRLVRA